MKSWRPTTLVIVAFVIALGLVITDGAISYSNSQEYFEQSNRLTHSRDLLASLEALGRNLVDAESGQRGFILTGEERFLESYHAGVQGVPLELAALRKLAADNPRYQKRLDEIEQLVALKLSGLKQRVEMRQTEGLEAARNAVLAGRGEELMNGIRRLVGEIRAEENESLALRDAEFRSHARVATRSSLTGTSVGVLLMLGVFFFLNREVRQRTQAEQFQRHLAAIVESAEDAIISKKLDGTIASWNPGAERMLGYRAEEMIGEPAMRLIPEDRIEEESRIIEKIRRGERISHFETLRRKNDGSSVEVSLTISPIRDDRGHVIGASKVIRDITERQETMRRLQRSEQRFRSLVTATSQLVWSTNAQGEVEDIPGWRAITGQTVEAVRGWGWKDALHPEDRERTKEIWVTALQNRSLYDTEYRVRASDGQYRYLSARGVPVMNEDGSIREWVGTCEDITERKRGEQALREAYSYTRSLIEASLDPLVTISSEGKITDVNEATVKVTGISRGKLIGTDFCTYFTEPDTARAGYQRVFSQGFVTDYPLTIRRLDGHRTEVLYNASVYSDAQGNVLGVFAAARDVTAQKQASQYARSLIEASLDPLVTISADGKITDVNEATVKVTGLVRSSLIGTDFSNYFTEPEKAREGYQQVFFKGSVTDYPLTVLHVNGSLTHVLYNATVYTDVRGNVLGVFAAARDVTAQQKAEEEIRKLNAELEQRVRQRTAQLEAANKELEAFTYSVSHDLRSPLRHIDGFSKILLEECHAQLDPTAQRYLERVRAGTQQMGHLVDDLLNLARVGRRELTLQVSGLNSILQEVLNDLKPETENRRIEWRVSDLPFVDCDPALIKQVFANLLSNAIKFTRPRERPIVEVGAVQQQGSPTVFVRDNGVGFNMKYADKLFGVFQRLHRAEDFEGTGVGLATVQRIIHKHGGKVWAEGELDKGATFYFSLGNAPDVNLDSPTPVEVMSHGTPS